MMGRYRVVGRREYRGHKTGTVFDARLETNAAGRAIRRGDIVLLEQTEPGLPPDHAFPDGWLTATQANQRGAERLLTR